MNQIPTPQELVSVLDFPEDEIAKAISEAETAGWKVTRDKGDAPEPCGGPFDFLTFSVNRLG